MTAAQVVDARVNPSNQAQRYILWSNGRIQDVGGAVPISGQDTWYHRTDQPIAVALHVVDWATGAAYMLDRWGHFHSCNGASTVTLTGGTNATNGVMAGVPYPFPRYVDWSWSTEVPGQGVVMDHFGKLYPFGGAPVPPNAGPMFTWPAAKKLQMRWSPDVRAIILDAWGGIHSNYAGVKGTITAYWRGWNIARDIAITEWVTGAGHVLDGWSGIHEIAPAPDTFGWPYRRGADVARKLIVLSAVDPIRMWVVWHNGQHFEFVSSTPPTVVAGGGTSEVQTVTITGGPTLGTWRLTFSGQQTATIAITATAAAVQTALEALSNIGVGDVSVTGNAGGPYTVTFTGALAVTDVAQMTATHTFTGGTTPGVTVATTVPGVTASPALVVTDTTRPILSWTYSDPQQDSQDGWELFVYTEAFAAGHDMSNPATFASSAVVAESGIERELRGIESPVDLANGGYRQYSRVRDTSGKWSAWDDHRWTQNVPVPSTPTNLVATASQATHSVSLTVNATTGQNANLVRFECSDDGGTTWAPVRDADDVPLIAVTPATDLDIPQGVTRRYRAVAYATVPRVASAPSNTATASLLPRDYVLSAVDDPSLRMVLWVKDAPGWSRPVDSAVFQGIGADFATVLSDGPPKGRRQTLGLDVDGRTEWDKIDKLVMADSVLLLRDPFGDAVYCRVVGDWSREQRKIAPRVGESTPLRHSHTVQLSLVEVRPPHLAG